MKLRTDVVVLGAGSAGLSAILTAASGGVNVIVIEKLPIPVSHTWRLKTGGALGFTVNSGSIAGENCLEYLNEEKQKAKKKLTNLKHYTIYYWFIYYEIKMFVGES